MAFIETPACARVAIAGLLFGRQIVNTLWFSGASNYAEGDLEDLSVFVGTWWTTQVLPVVSIDYTVGTITAYDMSSQSGPVFVNNIVAAGADASPSASGQNACVVTFNTPFRGRSGRGRNYISGIAEAELSANTVSSTVRTQLSVAYGALNAAVQTANNSIHNVVSFYENGVARGTGFKQPVTSYKARINVKAQRARSRL
jgi:hypothetical protein